MEKDKAAWFNLGIWDYMGIRRRLGAETVLSVF